MAKGEEGVQSEELKVEMTMSLYQCSILSHHFLHNLRVSHQIVTIH